MQQFLHDVLPPQQKLTWSRWMLLCHFLPVILRSLQWGTFLWELVMTFPNLEHHSSVTRVQLRLGLVVLTWLYNLQVGVFIISDFEMCCSAIGCHIVHHPASQTPLQKYFHVCGFSLRKTTPQRRKRLLPGQDLTITVKPLLHSTLIVQHNLLIRLVAGTGRLRKNM